MRRWLTWIVVALTLLALVAGDLMPMMAQAEEPRAVTVVPALPLVEVDGDTVHVAQFFGGGDQRPRRKRRSLMDMLFGREEQPVIQQPQPKQQKAPKAPRKQVAAPPPKPKVEKAPNATRLAVMGDSLATDVAAALDRAYAEDPNLVVVPMTEGSSGFVRQDFFDWSQKADEEIAKNSFDLAVMIIGINDRQTLKANGESYKSLTEGWMQIYRERVNAFVAKFRAANKPLIWIGLPPMSKSDFSQAMNQLTTVQRLAAFGGGAEFLDIYDRFLDEDGKYSSFGPDLSGKRVRMRKDDGVHFATGGADKVAFYLNQTIKLFYRGGGSVGFEVADPLKGTDAQLMVRPPYQGLGQIRLLEVAGAVIPLTGTQRRAVDLLTASSAEADTGFDLQLLVDAPAGRADAFGVGKRPGQNMGGR